MNKNLLMAVAVAVVLVAAGYWYWSTYLALTPEEKALQGAGDAAQAITESATQGVLPSLDVGANPLGDAPDVNPAAKTNPFSGIKTNPFQ